MFAIAFYVHTLIKPTSVRTKADGLIWTHKILNFAQQNEMKNDTERSY